MRFLRERQQPKQPLKSEDLEQLLRYAGDWEPDGEAPQGLAHRALAGKTEASHNSRRASFVPFSWWQMGGTVGVSALAAASVFFVQLSTNAPVGTLPEINDTSVSADLLADAAPQKESALPEATVPKPKVIPAAAALKAAKAKPIATLSRERRARARRSRRSNPAVREIVAHRGHESSAALSGAVTSSREAVESRKAAAAKTAPEPTPVWKEVEVQRPMYGMLAPVVLTATNEEGETEEMPVVLDVVLDSPPSSPNNFAE